MKKFRFRLQKVMEFKEEVEKQRKQELGKARKRVLDEEKVLDGLQARDHDCRLQIADKCNAETIDPREIDNYYRYLKQLKVQMEMQGHRIDEAKKIMEDKRQDLLAATKERKILEKLKERKYNDFMIDLARREQFVLDDLAGTAFARRRMEQ